MPLFNYTGVKRVKKTKKNDAANIVATMKLARELNCSYEEAEKKMKSMLKEYKNQTQ